MISWNKDTRSESRLAKLGWVQINPMDSGCHIFITNNIERARQRGSMVTLKCVPKSGSIRLVCVNSEPAACAARGGWHRLDRRGGGHDVQWLVKCLLHMLTWICWLIYLLPGLTMEKWIKSSRGHTFTAGEVLCRRPRCNHWILRRDMARDVAARKKGVIRSVRANTREIKSIGRGV